MPSHLLSGPARGPSNPVGYAMSGSDVAQGGTGEEKERQERRAAALAERLRLVFQSQRVQEQHNRAKTYLASTADQFTRGQKRQREEAMKGRGSKGTRGRDVAHAEEVPHTARPQALLPFLGGARSVMEGKVGEERGVGEEEARRRVRHLLMPGMVVHAHVRHLSASCVVIGVTGMLQTDVRHVSHHEYFSRQAEGVNATPLPPACMPEALQRAFDACHSGGHVVEGDIRVPSELGRVAEEDLQVGAPVAAVVLRVAAGIHLSFDESLLNGAVHQWQLGPVLDRTLACSCCPGVGQEGRLSFTQALEAQRDFKNPYATENMRKGYKVLDTASFVAVPQPLPGIASFEDLRRQQTTQWANSEVLKGIAKAKSGDYAGAIAAYDGALVIDAANVDALVAKGAALANTQQLEASITVLERAVRLKPEDGNAVKYLRAVRERLAGVAKEEVQTARKAGTSYKRMLAMVEDKSTKAEKKERKEKERRSKRERKERKRRRRDRDGDHDSRSSRHRSSRRSRSRSTTRSRSKDRSRSRKRARRSSKSGSRHGRHGSRRR